MGNIHPINRDDPSLWGYLIFYIFTVIFVGIALYLDNWYQQQQLKAIEDDGSLNSNTNNLNENFN